MQQLLGFLWCVKDPEHGTLLVGSARGARAMATAVRFDGTESVGATWLHGIGIPAFFAACLALARSSSESSRCCGMYGLRGARSFGSRGRPFAFGVAGSLPWASIASAMRWAA